MFNIIVYEFVKKNGNAIFIHSPILSNTWNTNSFENFEIMEPNKEKLYNIDTIYKNQIKKIDLSLMGSQTPLYYK